MRCRIACAAGVWVLADRGEEADRVRDRQVQHLGDVERAEPVVQHRRLEPPALAVLADRGDASHHRKVGVDHPAPLQVGQAPSELALNRAGLTPLAFANALRIGSSRPV